MFFALSLNQGEITTKLQNSHLDNIVGRGSVDGFLGHSARSFGSAVAHTSAVSIDTMDSVARVDVEIDWM